MRDVEVVVLGPEGETLEPGRIGEIAIRSPAMTRGYAGMEALNRQAFSGGFFLSGDRGRLDEEGRLFITGRTKLLIDVKGDKVDPIEVEDVLAVHPKVREVVVVGVRSGVEGEELVKAVVVPEGRARSASSSATAASDWPTTRCRRRSSSWTRSGRARPARCSANTSSSDQGRWRVEHDSRGSRGGSCSPSWPRAAG